MKIKELVVGDAAEITLVVISATAKETKAKKPYLALELFDGQDRINANYWDWTSGKVPAPNTILDVKAQVTEWQGVKQLNVRSLVLNSTANLADFAPTSEYDIADTYRKAHALVSEVSDDVLRTIARAALEELSAYWVTVPGAVSVHHNYKGGTLIHSYNVALKAKALAEVTEGANVDLAIVGGLLHDIGKLFTYRMNGATIDRTANGRLYEHIFIGAEFIGNFAGNLHDIDVEEPYTYAKIRMLRHIILSHHGTLEFGSPVTPQSIEAYIVHYADALDATNEQIRVATKNAVAANSAIWTDKIWTLNNCGHLSHKYVSDIMVGENHAAQ